MNLRASLLVAFGALGLVPQATTESFGYGDYAAVLKSFVNEEHLVDYKGLKAKPAQLDSFLTRLTRLRREDYEDWGKKEQVAFWVNAYNGMVLKIIISHYPIQSSWTKSLIYPKNSIRQIGGAFDDIEHTIMGQTMTLDDIEHGTLRKKFNEPRIHFALVCAAMSCPPLRREPYMAARLDAQLDDQARQFLRGPKGLRINRRRERVYLSSIFKWFGEDFIKTHGTSARFRGHSEKVRAVLNFASRHVRGATRQYLTTADYGVRYLDYDWSLNEQ
ncbi:MAG: DUF547 domain-containing protein [Planctomycetota bacterium]